MIATPTWSTERQQHSIPEQQFRGITTYAYYSSTTATSTTAGGVAGYQESTSLQQGTSGTAVSQEAWTYLANTAGGITIYNAATDTVYRNTDGTGAETTSYAYTYFVRI